MKSKLTIVLVLLINMTIFASKPDLDKFFNSYKGKEEYTSISISGLMYKFLILISDAEDEFLRNIDGIKILTKNNNKVDSNFCVDITQILDKLKYRDLIEVNDSKSNVKIMVLEESNKVRSLVVFVQEKAEDVFIAIEGDLDLKEISKLSHSMNIKGLEHLEKIDAKKKK